MVLLIEAAVPAAREERKGQAAENKKWS